jgi:hypothetical protein
MHILYLFFGIILLSSSVFSNSLNINIKNIRLTKNTQYCSYRGVIPILKITENSKLESSINKKLRSIFYKELNQYNSICRDLTKDKLKYSVNLFAKVALLTDSSISIYYTISEYEEGAAHPFNTNKSIILYFNTMEQIKYKDIVLDEEKFSLIVHKYLVKQLLKDKMIDSKNQLDQKTIYDFYPTKTGIYIYNIFDIHVLKSVQVYIPYSELKKSFNSKILGL